MSDYLKAGIVKRYKILKASLILMISSLILFFVVSLVFRPFLIFIGLVSFSFIIGVFLFISYLIITNKTTKWFKNSHMLHNEIEYNLEHQQIRFVKKNIIILASHIKSVKMEINQQVVYSSGIGEAIVGGVLFGGSGAIAGSIVGSRPKASSKAMIFIETDLIPYSGIAIKTTQQKGFEICKVLEALMD